MDRFGGKLIFLAEGAFLALVLAMMPAAGADSWCGQSLRDQSATGLNGIIAAAETLTVSAIPPRGSSSLLSSIEPNRTLNAR